MEQSRVLFGATEILYTIRRSLRRRTVSIVVDANLGVSVSAPAATPVGRLDAVVLKKARWILKHLQEFAHLKDRLQPKKFVSGEAYLFLGREYRLEVVSQDGRGGPVVVGDSIQVPVGSHVAGSQPAAAVREMLELWYRLRAAETFLERVASWAPRVEVPVPRVVIRGQKRRWGTCDCRGAIRFNWRVVQAPERLIDYVVVHELAHLREKNHSKTYWALVGRILPDYRDRRKELNRLGPHLDW
jgi:predicted metal-dependent hydrolase